MEKHKILIVEDERSLASLYKVKCDLCWYETHIAETWQKALSMLKDLRPDLILLDIMIPGFDGFETLKAIHTRFPSIKIIMFSNLSSQQDIQKSKALGAIDYLIKANTTPKELINKIEQYLH